MRYLDVGSRSHLERLQDLWFAPKRFESTALYERLGVLLVKRAGMGYWLRRSMSQRNYKAGSPGYSRHYIDIVCWRTTAHGRALRKWPLDNAGYA